MLSDIYIRIRSLFRRAKVEQELDDELRFHMDRQGEKYVQAGGSREEAMRRVRLEFGGMEQVKEDCRDAHGATFLTAVAQDVRYALRLLLKSRGFTLTAILTLALSIGASTAIFSLLDQALLRSLPVRDPQQLALLEATPYNVWNGHTSTQGGNPRAYFSYPMYKWLRDKNRVFSGLLATMQTQAGVTWHKHSMLVNTALVSGNYFDVLGVRPAVGSLLVQADDVVKDGDPVVVLGFRYWQQHFGSNPRVVGQTLDINGHPFQIIGVTQPGFQSALWGSPADIFVPMTMKPEITPGWDELDLHSSRWLTILGRLKPGETRAEAQARIAPLWHALRTAEIPLMGWGTYSKQTYAAFVTHSHLLVRDGATGFSYVRDDMTTQLWVIMGMATLLLLLASINVATLVLVRAAGRAQEISMRYALGAKRRRIVQQLLIEGLLLGIPGGLLGLACAPLMMRFLMHLFAPEPSDNPFVLQLNMPVLVAGLMAALLVSLLCTLTPALQFWKPELTKYLKPQSTSIPGGRLGFRRVLVGAQISLSLLLLVGAGLFVQTLQNLQRVHVGFATDHLITFGIDPAFAGYSSGAAIPLEQRLLRKFDALPGVASVGATTDPELEDSGLGGNISIKGYSPRSDQDMDVEEPAISDKFLATLQIPLAAGRFFTAADNRTAPKVALVNKLFADRFFGSPEKAIGHWIGLGAGNHEKYDIEIVGVVGNYLHKSLRGKVLPTLYQPLAQVRNRREVYYYIRIWSAPSAAIGMIRKVVRNIDPKLVLDTPETMQAQLAHDRSGSNMLALLALSFGCMAVLLAAVGIYGVLAYVTAQRTKEIGVRMALGADRAEVVWIVLRSVLLLAGLSCVVAVPIAVFATHLLRSQLYRVPVFDPIVLVAVVPLVMFVALCAAVFPARRAASVDPMEALRTE